MPELITQRAYAARRGVSAVAVHKAIKAGRIALVDGKIDPVAADLAWSRNTNAGQRTAKTAREALAPPPPEGGGGEGDGGQPPASGGSSGGQGAGPVGPNYGVQRAIREGYLARLAKIEYETLTGKLVEADKVRVSAFNLARKARDMMLALPDRLSPILAGESNPFEVHRVLMEELRRVCDEISRARAV